LVSQLNEVDIKALLDDQLAQAAFFMDMFSVVSKRLR
jgi:hypothetical protein